MLLADRPSDRRVLRQRVAGLHLLRLPHKLLDKAIVDPPLHKYSGPVGADLSLRQEVGHQGALHSVLDVRVVEDDQRTLATQLKSYIFHANSPSSHDLAAGGHTPGEGELVKALEEKLGKDEMVVDT